MRAILMQAGAVIMALRLYTVPLSAGSTNTNTNVAANVRLSPALLELLDKRQNGDRTFWEHFEDEVQVRGEKSAWRNIGLPEKITLLRFVEENGYGIHNEMNSRGKELFRRTAVYALRETATSRIPWETWEANAGAFPRFLINLFQGTLGNTDEEFIDPERIAPEPVNGLDPSWAFAETNTAPFRAWLKRLYDGSASDYGIRLGSDPYVYAKVSLFKLNRRPITSDTRLRLHSDLDGIDTLIRLQEQVRIPLAQNWSIVLGASLFPIDTRNPDWDYILSARLQKALRQDRIFWYIGTSSRRDRGESSKRTETGFFYLW